MQRDTRAEERHDDAAGGDDGLARRRRTGWKHAATPSSAWGRNSGLDRNTREPAKPASCPLASQIGTVEVFTPLLSGAPAIEGVPGKSSRENRAADVLCRACGAAAPTALLPVAAKRQADPRCDRQRIRPVLAEDEGKALQCQVTATNAGGSSVAVSRDVVDPAEYARTRPPRPPFPPSSIAAPSGTASAGQHADVRQRRVDRQPGTALDPFTYKWLRDGVQSPARPQQRLHADRRRRRQGDPVPGDGTRKQDGAQQRR